ncbi:hypothetical protein P9578_02330 [Brevibacillus choshinensis]|uniref:hypothetical protein n=1 Tax=Brevibacillus choshinensis TaxID=54911 RepID=UPI002E1F86BB|nr:hypothetical protein [Brevibacillus choshinensis]
MSDVIVFKGAISFPITLDPTVWVFDDRKFDLREYVEENESVEQKQSKYLQGTGTQWDKELREGSEPPSERKTMAQERKVLEGDYGIRLDPFITIAEPLPEVTHVRLHREDQDPVELPLAEARRAILQFAKDGKPIREKGPVYFYLPETLLAKESPIDGITMMEFINSK